jgi:hypothetical protein
LRSLEGAVFDTIMEKPFTQQQSMLDTTQPKGNYYYWKSEYFPRLTDEALSTIREQGALGKSPLSQMVLFHIEGAISERKDDDGAVGNRNAIYAMIVVGGWRPEDAEGERHIAWVRTAWEKLRPYSTGGTYINFQTFDEGEERIRASYGKNFDRLGEVKAKYDPQNMFRMNRNVSPSS